ncbi:uncharacterized protein EDB93DRAFT_816521 [Suillus bovinus]|uniref:uncharacterized protein n=1 Tax=Suillus bovinus TaxID=48563 RepID=UPI001B885475|nr:uncharacterized protein EDB93DRAFT_816521 [Suillus bovinus]KAG2157800.1 hypothetical protein EDB93DRAFT_816521 [Suillus bovinus]
MSLTFEGVDVVASCDHSVSFSSVTAQLLTRRLRRSNIVPDVRIRALVFITDGIINLSTDFLFLVVNDACSDVFGRDWLEYCWNISDNHRDVQLPEHPCCFVCSDDNSLNYGSSMPVKVYTPSFKSADSVKGEYLIQDMLFSASSTDATQLLPLLRNHGLENDFSPEQMNIQVLRHLLSGVCIHAGAGRTGPKACRLICRAFSDVHSLLGYIV